MPLIARNNLSSLKVKILRIESDFLNGLASQIGTCDLKFDIVMPVLIPESQIVESGTLYNGKLVLSTSHSFYPQLFVEGKEIDSIDYGRRIVYAFKASLKESTKDSIYLCDTTACGRFWNGKLVYKNNYGEDTTYNIRQEYFIRNPHVICK